MILQEGAVITHMLSTATLSLPNLPTSSRAASSESFSTKVNRVVFFLSAEEGISVFGGIELYETERSMAAARAGESATRRGICTASFSIAMAFSSAFEGRLP